MNRSSATSWYRSLLSCTCAFGMVIFSGCSGGQKTFPTGEVTGKVSFKGQAVSQGKITFISKSGTGYFGTGNIEDGAYIVKAPLGPCKIELQVQSDDSKFTMNPQQERMMKSKMKAMKEQGEQVPEAAPTVSKKHIANFPEKYRFADRSGLEFDVQAGPQTKDWDLK